MARTDFDYEDAPPMNMLFGDTTGSALPTDTIKSFMLSPRCRMDSVNRATALGLSQSSSWNVGGTLGVGFGIAVWETSLSVGGNYHRGENTSETLLTLVDLDGDGLADKVFMKRGQMYWRRQELSPSGTIAYGQARPVTGAGRFLVEHGTSNTLGVQASVAVANGSGSWSDNVTATPVYFADVDGDGLVDIVDDGDVLFNRPVGGQPVFERYSETHTGEASSTEPPEPTGASECGGIIFDGAVNDSVAFRHAWVLDSAQTDYGYGGRYLRELIESLEEDGYVIDHVDTILSTCVYRVFYYRGYYDPSWRDLAMRGVPATEAVRVWVAPDDGMATVESHVSLIENPGGRRIRSRHADGVTYSIQHSRNVDTTGVTLHSTTDTMLMR